MAHLSNLQINHPIQLENNNQHAKRAEHAKAIANNLLTPKIRGF